MLCSAMRAKRWAGVFAGLSPIVERRKWMFWQGDSFGLFALLL
jgi:hypothetical protein